MNISDLYSHDDASNLTKLRDIKKYAHTISFREKLYSAEKNLSDFLTVCNNPIISCGGGKDGTAVALLATLIGAKVPIICAVPPNPLPDREKHNRELRRFLGFEWTDVPYDWDVDAVLHGQKPYPEGLKMRVLSEYQAAHRIDGVIFGVRAAESRSRSINAAVNGASYILKDGGKRCQPIVKWSAYDSLCLALLLDAPINPVYEKMGGVENIEQLHDGTWWPHGLDDRLGWMRRYYPEYAEKYEKALEIQKGGGFLTCRY